MSDIGLTTSNFIIYWSARPISPSNQKDVIVAGFLSIYLSNDLVFSVWSRPLCNCLVNKINQGRDVFTHKHTELPASSFSIKQVCTRLIILTGGKNNSKIKIAQSGKLAVGSHPFDCKYASIISENADSIDCLYGEGVCEKVGFGVK